MFFNGPYLRVLSPVTTNGVNLKIGEDDKVVYKEAHLPLSAKRELEKQNAKLADHLKKKIEVVGNNAFMEESIARKKPGPKPKIQQ